MSEAKKYTGGCHCGKVRYEVTTDLAQVGECNCSICTKKATLLAFVGEDQFSLLSGEEALTNYQFNKKAIHHLFCSVCGIESFAKGTAPDGKGMVAINVRCLDDVDVSNIRTVRFNGKAL